MEAVASRVDGQVMTAAERRAMVAAMFPGLFPADAPAVTKTPAAAVRRDADAYGERCHFDWAGGRRIYSVHGYYIYQVVREEAEAALASLVHDD